MKKKLNDYFTAQISFAFSEHLTRKNKTLLQSLQSGYAWHGCFRQIDERILEYCNKKCFNEIFNAIWEKMLLC